MKLSRKKLIITSIISAVCIACVLIAMMIKRSTYITQCDNVHEQYTRSYTSYTNTISKARTVLHMIGDKSGVLDTDVSVYTRLTDQMNHTIAHATLQDCHVNLMNSLMVTVDHDNQLVTQLQETTHRIEQDTHKLQASYEKKQVNDAINRARGQLTEATHLYTQSDNKVADENTRNNLKQNIDSLQTLLTDKNVKLDDIDKNMNTLSQSMNTVNASMQAKTQEEQRKAAQAAAAAVARQAQARSQTRSRSTTPHTRPNTNNRNNDNFDLDAYMREAERAHREKYGASQCEKDHTCQYAIG